MATAAEVLRANGIVADPAIVIRAAADAGLPLPGMAAKLVRESYGGRNVIGHDRVDTGGVYVMGGDAGDRRTTEAYLRWRGPAGRNRGRQQGWGPSQLTWAELQDQAEEAGGLNDPYANMLVGARELARCLRAGGGSWREAGARYNGGRAYASSSDDAKGYGRWLEGAVADWDARLRGATVTAPATGAPSSGPSSSGRPTLREGDVSALVFAVATHMNRVFPAYSRIDTGPGPTCRLGPQCIAALTEFQRRSGIPTDPPFAVAARTWAALEASGFRG